MVEKIKEKYHIELELTEEEYISIQEAFQNRSILLLTTEEGEPPDPVFGEEVAFLTYLMECCLLESSDEKVTIMVREK